MNAPSQVDLVIRGGVVLTAEPGFQPFEADVAVSNGRIAAVGPNLPVVAARVVEGRGDVVMPGLVNAHMHETMERGLFADLPFMEWLNDFALPKDMAYEPRHMRASALLNQLEMIRGGTTSFIDIFRHPSEAASVAETSGLRATFAPQLIDTPAGSGETLDSSIGFIETWRGRVPDRIRTWFGPHALYSCEEATYRRVRELADGLGVGIHTHLAETEAEVGIVAGRSGGLTPTAWLDRLLGLGPDVLAAHCVQLTAADMALLAERDVAVAHCPSSNMKLGNGAAPIPSLREAGVRVGLGTDSNMTNNDLDMFEEMRLASFLQKLARRDAAALPARQVLEMATIGSARALGLGDDVGSIEVGKKADLIVVSLGGPHTWPAFREAPGNVIEHVVFACHASDVRTTIVDGRILMEDGVVRSIEQAEVEDLVDRESRDLLRKAGVLERLIGGAGGNRGTGRAGGAG